mgnify:CR=1 FL=1
MRRNDSGELLDKNGLTEREFLAAYRADRYPRPSVTADIMLLSETPDGVETLLIRRGEESSVSLQVALPEEVQAPVAKGDTLGELRVLKDGNLIATLPATASEDVGLPGYLEALLRILQAWRR